MPLLSTPRRADPILEQITYSGSRYLFWVLAPLLLPNEWRHIAALSLLNLFVATLYGGLVGGPVFIEIARRNGDFRRTYLPAQAIVLIISLASTVAWYLTASPTVHLGQLTAFALFIWVSSATDWARKTNIAIAQLRVQCFRNVIHTLATCVVFVAIHIGTMPKEVGTVCTALGVLYGCISLRIPGTSRPDWRNLAMPTPRLWSYYIVAGLAAYVIGNYLLLRGAADHFLSSFVVVRNYFTPATVIALILETHGVLYLRSCPPDKLQRTLATYLVAAVTGSAACAVFVWALAKLTGNAQGFPLASLLLASLLTFFVIVAKFPTVVLRLRGIDFPVTAVYAVLAVIWLALGSYINFAEFAFAGLELLVGQYLLICIVLLLLMNRSSDKATPLA